MSKQTLPPLEAITADDGALAYRIKPEGSSGMGLRLIINPDGSMLLSPIDPRIKGFSLDSEAGRLLRETLNFHFERDMVATFQLAV